ncbi:hypothetical protein FRB93_012028 [Tulasnella sp. JGI-2019a]|nr:hypothetical protein FRB93_012028 [Tulasnella sp. JGI-2019a]
MGRFDLARADSKAALSVLNHPQKPEVMDKLARCHIALGDPTAALQQAQEALKLNPLDSSILATVSIAEKMHNDFHLSRDAWARRDWLEAKGTLARVIVECIGGYPLEWRICEVEVEIATRNWEAAISKAETTTELPRCVHNSGPCINKLVQCTIALQSALRLNPNHSWACSTLHSAHEIERTKTAGDQAFQLGRYDEAVRKYTEALPIVGSDEKDGGGYLRAVLSANRVAAL